MKTGRIFWLALVCSIALLLVVTACTSKHPKVADKEDTNKPAPASASADHFDGGTYCVQTFLQGPAPAQPLHFSNKVTESDPALKSKDFQGDLAGDNLDLVHRDRWLATDQDRKFFEETQNFTDPKMVQRVIKDGYAEETITNHFTRSDAVGWRGGIMSVSQGGTPWGLFIYKPPVSRVGTENVNGYDTIKYAVDTTHESSTDKAAGLLRQVQDYNITGTAWVLKDAGCVLQYDITDTQTGKDGKVRTTHYEGTVTKK